MPAQYLHNPYPQNHSFLWLHSSPFSLCSSHRVHLTPDSPKSINTSWVAGSSLNKSSNHNTYISEAERPCSAINMCLGLQTWIDFWPLDAISSGSHVTSKVANTDKAYGWIHARTLETHPLPQGYDWKTQIAKYSSSGFWGNPTFESATKRTGLAYHGPGTPRNRIGVFCHRGLYDHKMEILENTVKAIENGMMLGLLAHEIDAQIGEHPSEAFVTHDETGERNTNISGPLKSHSNASIKQANLVIRRYDLKNLTSLSTTTEESLPGLRELFFIHNPTFCHRPANGLTFQIDLRGNDFARAIAWWRLRTTVTAAQLIFKGYNIWFKDGEALEKAVEDCGDGQVDVPDDPSDTRKFEERWPMRLIIVFFDQPIVDIALEKKNLDSKSQDDRRSLEYDYLLEITREHISSFKEVIDRNGAQFIPEIVHKGLGLRYDKVEDRAFNPLDGKEIEDEDVRLESRVDSALIEVAEEMRKDNPDMIFSSCTRLCDIRDPDGHEFGFDMRTGLPKPKPGGEKGIAAKLRALHGGLYPRSDIVVADDPLAEIAARTWIDEHARLDRAELRRVSYDEWLAGAPPDVGAALRKLNGPFLPSTYVPQLDGDGNIRDVPEQEDWPLRPTTQDLERRRPGSLYWYQHPLREQWQHATRGTPYFREKHRHEVMFGRRETIRARLAPRRND